MTQSSNNNHTTNVQNPTPTRSKKEEIKSNSRLNSIHHKFQKDDKRKNNVKKQQIKAQIFKDKKKQNAGISMKRKKSEYSYVCFSRRKNWYSRN